MIPLPDKATVAKTAGASSLVGFLYGIDPETFTHILSETAKNQIAQAGFFFTLAALIHSSRTKKEIRSAVEAMTISLTTAINNVAVALRNDLAKQSEILMEQSKTIANHTDRLENLEKKNPKGGINGTV